MLLLAISDTVHLVGLSKNRISCHIAQFSLPQCELHIPYYVSTVPQYTFGEIVIVFTLIQIEIENIRCAVILLWVVLSEGLIKWVRPSPWGSVFSRFSSL